MPRPRTTNDACRCGSPQLVTSGPQSPVKFRSSARVSIASTEAANATANVSQSDSRAFTALVSHETRSVCNGWKADTRVLCGRMSEVHAIQRGAETLGQGGPLRIAPEMHEEE